jgi:hypothetical protein
MLLYYILNFWSIADHLPTGHCAAGNFTLSGIKQLHLVQIRKPFKNSHLRQIA